MKNGTVLVFSVTLAVACTQVDPPGVARAYLITDDAASSACAHSACTSGVALVSSCSPCATTVCAVDPYCCQTAWDETCVGEGKSLCAGGCDGPAADAGSDAPETSQDGAADAATASCSHPVCSVGAALVASCDSCAQVVCGADPYCCSGGWDTTCVGEAVSLCGVKCP
jgi:hypothetical protein